MSDEEKKDLGDKAKEAAQEAADKAKEFAQEAKEEAKEFAEGAKETAKEFTDNLKEATNSGDNKKILAGILAIFLGSLGVHKFILGYQKEGFILLGATILAYATTCLAIGFLLVWIPYVIGIVEGIIYLTKSDEEFYNTYQAGKKPWF
ncbi:TM2 domain-containing protein [Sediminicola luteus]|uniref:TM2 domain-containing protein n=1 Tax=Sediminicola luteus TaxID=319238 RepID=A0A2A4GDR8_9FLAO|nr:TM2 domain-containing protein [Sediminicola luteus]PCE66134.1 hypothetical protein B7P33_02210 [Sediminicola luteus]